MHQYVCTFRSHLVNRSTDCVNYTVTLMYFTLLLHFQNKKFENFANVDSLKSIFTRVLVHIDLLNSLLEKLRNSKTV